MGLKDVSDSSPIHLDPKLLVVSATLHRCPVLTLEHVVTLLLAPVTEFSQAASGRRGDPHFYFPVNRYILHLFLSSEDKFLHPWALLEVCQASRRHQRPAWQRLFPCQSTLVYTRPSSCDGRAWRQRLLLGWPRLIRARVCAWQGGVSGRARRR